MLKETWAPGVKVNKGNLTKRLEDSEEFRKAWGWLEKLKGDKAMETLRMVVK